MGAVDVLKLLCLVIFLAFVFLLIASITGVI